MRIIDKNHDFYDYLQDSTDPRVFDRRNSYLLTKDMLKGGLYVRYYSNTTYRMLLLQCGATFWLFLLKFTNYKEYNRLNNATGYAPLEYNVELLDSWKNYDKPNKLLNLETISTYDNYNMYDYNTKDFIYENIISNVPNIRKNIDTNNYRVESSFSNDTKYPLLKACGISSCIDPLQIFCAIEEYFSIEKTKAETTEPKGATNDDKIIMHGFDTKISFRGKNNRK